MPLPILIQIVLQKKVTSKLRLLKEMVMVFAILKIEYYYQQFNICKET